MKKFLPIFISGLVLRLILMSVGIHSDIRAPYLAGYLIAQKGQLGTFYDYISRLPRDNPLVGIYGDGQFNYPPLAYLSHGIFNFLLWPLYPPSAWHTLIWDFGHFRGVPGSTLLLIILKLPYLIADVLILVFVTKLLPAGKKQLGLILWVVNPFVLYSAYLMGQDDVIIALGFVLAIYFSSRRQGSLAAISLGLAAGFKPFALIVLPFMTKDKWRSILVGLVTYGLIVLPYMGSTAFKHYALFAAQSDKPLYAKIMVSGSQYLPLFIVGIVGLWWWNRQRPKDLAQWAWLATPLLLFFAVTHWHPQWLTWLTPFLLLAAVLVPKTRWPIAVLTLVCVGIVLTFDNTLTFGLVGENVDLWQKLTPVMSLDLLASLLRGVLAGTSLALGAWLYGTQDV